MAKPEKIKKTYKAVKGSKLSDAQAKLFGQRIEWLMDQNGHDVTAEDIIQDGKNPKSPFHKYLEWNDRKAGQQWRLNQARYILRSISVIVQYDDGDKKLTRAFVNVNRPSLDDEDEKRSVYVSVETALSKEDLRRQLLETALDELQSWQQRYKMLKELSIVFESIYRVKKKLRKH